VFAAGAPMVGAASGVDFCVDRLSEEQAANETREATSADSVLSFMGLSFFRIIVRIWLYA